MWSVTKLTDSIKVRLGGLGIFDLLWRVPQATPGDGTVGDIILVPQSLVIGEVNFLESITVWLLIGYASFTLASKAYPGLTFPKENRGFRLLFTIATIVVVVVILQPFLLGEGQLASRLIGELLVWIITFGSLFAVYLHHLGWSIDPADDRPVTTLARLSSVSNKEARRIARKEWTAPGWQGTVNRGTAWAALGMAAAAPSFLAGIAAAILIASSPIGELLFLSAILVSAILQHSSFKRYGSPATMFDLETYLYDSISQSIRAQRGLILLIYIFGILLLALGFLALGVVFWQNIAVGSLELLFNRDTALVSDSELYVFISASFGVLTILITGFTYAAWAALREIPRLAAFVDAKQGKSPRDVPPRPVGFVIPGLLVLPLFFLVVRWLQNTFGGAEPVSVELQIFAIGWPLLLIGLFACWWLTRRRTSTPVKREDHTIIGSAALLPVLFAAGSAESSIIDAVGFVVVIVGLGYFPYADEYANQQGDERFRRHGRNIYVILWGVILWSIARTVGAFVTGFLSAFAGLVIIFGALGTVTTVIDTPEGEDDHSGSDQRPQACSDQNHEKNLRE